jgi:hypothetical protein
MQALDEGRRRAAQEQHATTRALATDKQTLEVRSHVLSSRETELESRLRGREQRQASLEAQLQDLTTLLRKEQATRDAQAPPDCRFRGPTLKARNAKADSSQITASATAQTKGSTCGSFSVWPGPFGLGTASQAREPEQSATKQGGPPAKARKRTPGKKATTRRRR